MNGDVSRLSVLWIRLFVFMLVFVLSGLLVATASSKLVSGYEETLTIGEWAYYGMAGAEMALAVLLWTRMRYGVCWLIVARV